MGNERETYLLWCRNYILEKLVKLVRHADENGL